MAIRPDIDQLTDSLDAAVFSGDAFYDDETRVHLRKMMIHWTARLNEIQLELESEPCREDL